MSEGAIKFIHKDGKVIPIRAPGDQGHSSVTHQPTNKPKLEALKQAAKTQVAKFNEYKAEAKYKINQGLKSLGSPIQVPNEPIKPNKRLDYAGLGLSIASGVIGAATASGGMKRFAAGTVASHALDAAGITLNVASVAGKGRSKDRLKQGAKQETRNFLIGNGIYVAGLVGFKQNRMAMRSASSVAFNALRRIVRK